jgi:hypothetical protein
MRIELFLPAGNDQERAKRNRSRAHDDRDNHRFLLLDPEFERAQLRGVGIFGVTEATVYQSQDTCCDQHYSDDFLDTHMHLPPNGGSVFVRHLAQLEQQPEHRALE